MSYQSPIDVIYGDMQTKLEGDVLKVIQNYDITVDKDELLKALNYDRDQYHKGWSDGYVQANADIVHCKDCKHRPIPNGVNHPLAPKLDGWRDYVCPCLCDDEYYNFMPDDNDFCSRGERKESEGNALV